MTEEVNQEVSPMVPDQPTYPPFVQCMLSDIQELRTKLESLGGFLGTPEFEQLPAHKQALLVQQHAAMSLYAFVLGLRIDTEVAEIHNRQF